LPPNPQLPPSTSILKDDVWISQLNLPQWNPFFYYTNNVGHACIESEYNFYFKMSDLTVDPNLYFTNNSKFHFNLLQCCNALPQTDYSIKFSLLLDEGCANFTPNSNFSTPPACSPTNGGSCCWLPLNKEEKFINVHCPGCKAPGIIVDNFTLLRTTFGFEDANNDGKADVDGSGNMIPINITPPSSYSMELELNKNGSVHGDKVEGTLIAHFQNGETPPIDPGYTL
jgi:hypothetical protein